MDREQLLGRTFVQLADTLVNDFDVVEFLHTLTSAARDVMDLNAAGVMLADEHGRLRVVASSDEQMRMLELFELEAEDGPCVDAFRSGHAVQAAAAEAGRRWPRFAVAAQDAGYSLMCAVPLRLRDQSVGALNMFRSTQEPLSDAELATAQAMADIATIGMLQERALRESRLLAEQLEHALSSRVVIEQAKGVIAERAAVSVDQAFASIRRYARSNNRKLTDVAKDVVERRVSLLALMGSARPEPDSS